MSLLKEKLELKVEETEFKAEQSLNKFPLVLKWFVIIGALAVIPAYFIARTVSQKSWQVRYKQYELVAKPSFTNPMNLKVSDTTVITLENGGYAAAVMVQNENVDLSLNETQYKMLFYNHKSELVYTASDHLFLLPNQKKYLVFPKVNVNEQIASVKLEFSEKLPWVKRQQLPKVNLITTSPSVYHQYNPLAFIAEGSYQNQSSYLLNKIRLTFLVFDRSNRIIAVSQRDDFTIAPNEKRDYKQIWSGMFLADADHIEVYADTDILNPENISVPKSQSNPASDLDRPETEQMYW